MVSLTYLALGKLLNGTLRFTFVVNIMTCNPDPPFQDKYIFLKCLELLPADNLLLNLYPNNYQKICLAQYCTPSSRAALIQRLFDADIKMPVPLL